MAHRGCVTTIGPYRIARRLGTGGMGTVYLGHDRSGRAVAVKVLHEHLRDDAVFRQRFAQEVVAAQRVAGFCTARVLDADIGGRLPYLVTEYVDGMSLHERVSAHGPLSAADTEALAVGSAAALTAIHAAGVVHRDLKPSNVMLSSVGTKVIDFGIAGAADPAATPVSVRFGTPGWLAPKQLAGQPGGPAADVYAWGLLVAWAATGRHPYGDDERRRKADLTGVAPRLLPHVRACLAADPKARPTAAQLLLALCGSAAGAATVTRPLPAPHPRAFPRPSRRPSARRRAIPLPPTRVAPPPPAPPRVRRRTRWRLPALTIGLALFAIWLVGSQHGSGGRTEAAVPPGATPTAAPARPGGAPSSGPAGTKDGAFRFAVTGVRCGTTELGTWPTRKQAKGQFCLVDLRVTNEGKHAGLVFVSSQRLEDATGAGYGPDEWAWIYYEGSRAFTSTVDKGATVDGTLVYDVPAGVQPARLIVHDTPLSGGATIALRAG